MSYRNYTPSSLIDSSGHSTPDKVRDFLLLSIRQEPLAVKLQRAKETLDRKFDIHLHLSDRSQLIRLIEKHSSVVFGVRNWDELFLPEEQAVVEFLTTNYPFLTDTQIYPILTSTNGFRDENLNRRMKEYRESTLFVPPSVFASSLQRISQ